MFPAINTQQGAPMITIQKLQLPENYGPPRLFCPACGAPIYCEDDTQSCPHLVIAIDPSGPENALIGEKYQAIFEEILADEDFDGELLEAFLEENDQESFLKFEVAFNATGMGGYSISAVFDFAP
jgi:hypothetical protein